MAYESSILSVPPNLGTGILTEPDLVLTALFSLFLSSISISYMFLKGMDWSGIVESLGLNTEKFNMKLLLYGITIFFVIFLLEIAVTVASSALGIQISTNTGLLLSGAPAWFLVFATFISPINEEIFFRGFLIKGIAHISSQLSGTVNDFYKNTGAAWTGILLGAFLFGLSHASYDSTFGIDMLAAGLFGILAGYVYRKTRSLYPSIIAHMLVNLLAVVAFIA